MTAISSYYATVGVRTSKADISRVDQYLKRIEGRMKRFQKNAMKSLRIDPKMVIDTQAFKQQLKVAYSSANRMVPFRITNFQIDQTNLNRVINRSIRNAITRADRTVGLNGRYNPRNQGGIPPRHILGGGAVAGATSRLPHLGAAFGLMYGGGMLMGGANRVNQANQEMISARLTTTAVTEAAGLQGQGPQAFEWLRNQSYRLGFNYMNQAPDYNSFLSNALGAGQDLGGAQDIYKGFAEYQRAMGISPARQKLVMSALSQMLGKGKVNLFA
tara:strand:+ start:32393 stop:33208 length:816 start_codon:yes stop_codon:yes gene_type:complete